MKIWKSIALALSTFAIMTAAFLLSSAAPKVALADASSSSSSVTAESSGVMRLTRSKDNNYLSENEKQIVQRGKLGADNTQETFFIHDVPES